MQLETQKFLNRNDAISAFLTARAPFLATWARVAQLQTQLQNVSVEIADLAAQQGASGGASSQQVALKATLIHALTEDLRDMARTAQTMALTDEGIEKKFELPTRKGEQSIVGAARQFQTNATVPAVKAEFIELGMQPDFLTHLGDDIALYDEMLSGKNSARQQSSQSLRELEAAIAHSSQIADALNAMMKNIYHADPATLKIWDEAKRLPNARAHRAKI